MGNQCACDGGTTHLQGKSSIHGHVKHPTGNSTNWHSKLVGNGGIGGTAPGDVTLYLVGEPKFVHLDCTYVQLGALEMGACPLLLSSSFMEIAALCHSNARSLQLLPLFVMLLRSADDLSTVKGASLAPNSVEKRLNFRSLGHISHAKKTSTRTHGKIWIHHHL